jgi:signal peptidase II
MRKLNPLNYWPLALSLVIWLAIDLLTKAWAASADLAKMVFVDNFFYLTLHHNVGVAFGISFGEWPQIILSLLILAALLAYAIQQKDSGQGNGFLQRVLLGIIMGGALGNLANRILLGYVIDFIYLKPIPVFNFADIGITLGLVVLILISLKKNS